MMRGMDLVALRSIIGGAPLGDVVACRLELEHIRAGRGLLDAREVEVLALLDELAAESPSIFPEDEVAKAAKSSLTKASRVRSRKKACDDVPELGDALAAGATTGERVDTLAKATAGLSPAELERVAAAGCGDRCCGGGGVGSCVSGVDRTHRRPGAPRRRSRPVGPATQAHTVAVVDRHGWDVEPVGQVRPRPRCRDGRTATSHTRDPAPWRHPR